MLFPNTFSLDIQRRGKRFTLQNILSVPSNITGVYVLYHKRSFVYVGQSKGRLKERMIKHYSESHNKKLAVWIEALDGDVEFTYITCQTTEVDDFEKSLICYLQPITNEERYISYTPKRTIWRKTHG